MNEAFLRDFFRMPRAATAKRPAEAYLVEWTHRGTPHTALIRRHDAVLAYIRDNEIKDAAIVPLVRS